jgi:hypothetical protein
MSTQEQARALMMRHQHSSKNRQQTMLNRAAAEMGVDLDILVPAAQPTKKQ